MKHLIAALALAFAAPVFAQESVADRVKAIEEMAAAKAARVERAKLKKNCPCKTDCGCPPGKCQCTGGECNCVSCGGTVCECSSASDCTCEGKCLCMPCMVWSESADASGYYYLYANGQPVAADHASWSGPRQWIEPGETLTKAPLSPLRRPRAAAMFAAPACRS